MNRYFIIVLSRRYFFVSVLHRTALKTIVMDDGPNPVQMAGLSLHAFSLGLPKLSAEVDDWIKCDKGGADILDPLFEAGPFLLDDPAVLPCRKHADIEPDQISFTLSCASDSTRVAWPDDRVVAANASSDKCTHHAAADNCADLGHAFDHVKSVQKPTFVSCHAQADTSDRQRPGRLNMKPRRTPPAQVTAPFVRKITCDMTLRVLNIPQAMHAHLGLCHAYPLIGHRRLRHCTIYIRSPDGFRHPVRMVAASGSRHRRLADGWRAFCMQAGVQVGDAIHFHRTVVSGVLNASIDRRDPQAEKAQDRCKRKACAM